MRVCVVDYGIGNIQSVANACARLGLDVRIAHDADELHSHSPQRIILPGVGAVGHALEKLRKRGLVQELEYQVNERGVPFLGICVGMQILVEQCEEFGIHEGLGWIPGSVTRLAPGGSGVLLPHVGWNTIRATPRGESIVSDFDTEHFYFTHSYVVQCPDAYVASHTSYEGDFISAIQAGHVYGVQFHPEKSSALGSRLLRLFVEGSQAIDDSGAEMASGKIWR